ncbi:MAG: hypothetical protein R2867_38640 [Caldilineaceae bacterium]
MRPLTGQYEGSYKRLSQSSGSTGLARFVVGGGVFGFMGTDTLGRPTGAALCLPVAPFIGLVVAIVETAIGTSLGITSGYLGGRTDLAIQRAATLSPIAGPAA